MSGEAEPAKRGHGPDWAVWLAWTGLVLLFAAVSVQKIWAGDFWGQLRTGQWILEHHAFPRVDEYTFTRAGTPVTEVRWLYCVAVALGWRVGAWLLCVAQAALLGAMWAVLAWRSRGALLSPWGVLVLGLAVAAGSGRWVLRPELMTDFCVAVFLVGLERIGEPDARRAWRCAVALVASQVVWVNTHSVYIFGPVLAWTFAGARALETVQGRVAARVRDRPPEEAPSWRVPARLAVVALAITAACWVNPYGTRGAMYALEMWRESRAGSVTGALIGELRSPFAAAPALWTWDVWATLALIGAAGCTFMLNWRRFSLTRAIVFAAGVYLAATAMRNAALFAVIGAWAGFRNLFEAAASRGPSRKSIWKVGREAALLASAAISAAFAWYIATDRHAIAIGAPKEFGLGVVEWDTPRGAADFVVSSGARPQVFNSIRDAHYLGWRSGGRIKVFVDGRTDVIGDDLLAEFERLSTQTWDATAARWGINTAIIPVRQYGDLIAYLNRSPAWALVNVDHRNMVFVRNIPEHAALIATRRIDPAKPWPGPLELPEEAVEPWKAAFGGRARPWFSLGMAESLLSIGAFDNAAAFLERGVQKFPWHERLRATLAAVYRYQGKRSEAAAVEGTLDRRSPIVLSTESTLAGWLEAAGRRAEAAQTFEGILEAAPEDRAVRINLADQYFQLGDFARARDHYRRVLEGTTGPAPEWKKLGYCFEQTKDPGAATDAYRISLAADPNQPDTWLLLGRLLARQHKTAEAAEAFRQALRIKPDYGAAQQALDALRAP